jgi:hypothetical protein
VATTKRELPPVFRTFAVCALDVSGGPHGTWGLAGVLSSDRWRAGRPPPLSLIERSLNHRSWLVRDAAIAAVEGYDRPRAAAPPATRAGQPYLAACRNAIKRLSAITGEKQTFDCLRPADRQRARAHWASLVDRDAP